MKTLAIMLGSCMLVACGGGGSSSSPAPANPAKLTVNGTAATGKAIAGAMITAKCQTGTGNATSLADGSYSLAAAGGQLPCLLQITDPADGSKLHTLVLGSGNAATANITPLTEMLTARVLGNEPAVFFAAFDSAIAGSKINSTAVKAAQADVAAVLSGVVDTTPLADFLSTPLKAATQGNPAGGDAQDRVLDALRIKINAAQLTQVVTALAKISNPDTIKQVIADIAAVPPVAQAGPAQSVVTGTVVTLDASASSAYAGRTLSYAWTLQSKPAGSTASLLSPTSARPTFTADVAGTYVASVIVNDGKVSSNAAAVSITASVANAAPVANAGYAQNVLSGSVVELDGSASSDANGDVLTFAWMLTEKPANSTATLSSASAARTSFTADASGLYVAKLIVNDGKASSADATVTVSASAVDTSGPSVSAITVTPATVNVSQASQRVTATVTVTDATGINLNALPHPYWHSIADIGGTRIDSKWVLAYGDAKHATFSSTVTIPAGAKAGSWTVGWTAFRDTLGYTSTNGGYEKSFTVQSNELSDTSGPAVSAITVNPTTVDVSQASQLVTATVTVTDATGVNLNALPNPYWYNVADIGGTRIDSKWMLASGDAKHATFSSTVTIPTGAKAGSWTVGWTAFRDTLGYTSTNGGYEKSFTVQSNGLGDTSGPAVSAITVNPTTVDVSQTSQLVTTTVIVTDATGINLNVLPNPYWYNIADIGGTRIDSKWVLASGDAKHATFSSTVTIPAGAKAGQWVVGWTAFRDTLGYTSTNGGYDKSFTVK
ncbi:PKD domain-containing protein [Janthinobacterium sp. GMG2]|uniref:PKD domain-containing protein n=1 Tax=Janthinobacterium sp. GMG2 TaxID=3096606 RepID=UPI0029F49B70|nr:PKD domain-containing protein [Janthinobacterium sp. GMG2]MDX8123225.1 PKD domain-containing protein [Janthinobacterium sp. GMG2]